MTLSVDALGEATGGDATGVGAGLGVVAATGVDGEASGEFEDSWLGCVQAAETKTIPAAIAAKTQPPLVVTRTTLALQSVSALWGIRAPLRKKSLGAADQVEVFRPSARIFSERSEHA